MLPSAPVGTPPLDPWRVSLKLQPVGAKVHGTMPPTNFWSYEGSVPGPTIVVNTGERIRVKYINQLSTAIGPANIPFASYVVPDPDPDLPMLYTGNENAAKDTRLDTLIAWTVTHLHGAPAQGDSDGWTDNMASAGEIAEKVYDFPVEQYWLLDKSNKFSGGIAPTFWYHDHAMGVTRFNVYAGLAGMWLVRHPIEHELSLPTHKHELPLVIQDRNFDTVNGDRDGLLTGQLLHKVQENIMECFAPATLVNGKLWPHARVEPTLYRLRIVNGSNARFYRLHFMGLKSQAQQVPEVLPAKFVQQIGTDGGLLGNSIDLPVDGVPNAGCLLLAPGERADVLIDLGGVRQAGWQHVVVYNSAPAPFGSGSSDPQPLETIYTPDPDNLRPYPAVMRFDIACEDVKPKNIQGMKLLGDKFHRLDHHQLPQTHDHTLIVLREENGMLFMHEMMEESEADAMGMNMHKVFATGSPTPTGIRLAIPEIQPDGTLALAAYVTVAKGFNDTATIHIEKDSWRVWRIINLSPDTHPFHIHLVQFQGLKRYTLTPKFAAGQTSYPKDEYSFEFELQLPSADLANNEQGWKDTIRVNPGNREADTDNIQTAEMLSLAAQFTGHAGRYMYHCHILEHEDQEMMRPFVVTPSAIMKFMKNHSH